MLLVLGLPLAPEGRRLAAPPFTCRAWVRAVWYGVLLRLSACLPVSMRVSVSLPSPVSLSVSVWVEEASAYPGSRSRSWDLRLTLKARRDSKQRKRRHSICYESGQQERPGGEGRGEVRARERRGGAEVVLHRAQHLAPLLRAAQPAKLCPAPPATCSETAAASSRASPP
eukprot:3735274-Rhodomonas_salina.1